MTFLKRFHYYRVYRRLLLSYLLLIIITITVLCTILYMLFSAKTVQEIDRSSQAMLSQVSYTANVVFKQIEDITNHILNDSQSSTFLYGTDDDKMVNFHESLLLTKMRGVYPFISDISLYNFTNGEYLDAGGLPPDSTIATHHQEKYLVFYPRKIEQKNMEPLKILTFEIHPKRTLVTSSKSAIVLNLKESYIQNTMQNISSSSGNASTFVIDSEGTVLSHSNASYFMENFSKKDYVREILAGTQNQGSFVWMIDHKKHLITYVKSTTLDWYFISVRPYDQLLSNIYELRNWTLVFALILFVVGAVISLLVTGNMYIPIKALVDKVTDREGGVKHSLLHLDEYKLLSEVFTNTIESAKTMESNLYRTSKILKNSYMFNLLKGNAENTFISSEIHREWQSRLKGPFYAVILFKIDNFRSFKEKYNAFDRRIIHFAICNIAQDLLGKTYINDIAMMEEEEAVLILQTDHPKVDDNLYFILSEIQEVVHTYYKITVSISIGNLYTSIEDIRNSYQSAQKYMTHRLFKGYGCLLDESEVGRDQEYISRYPASSERKLIDAIKLCQTKSIQKEIADWLNYISRSSYSQAIQYTNFLLLAIIREFENITEWWGGDPNDLYLRMNKIHYAETLDEIQNSLKDFCFHIVFMIEDNKNNAAAIKSTKVVDEIKQFLHERFADPGISLELASEQVGLTAGYVGKLFKNIVGSSFNDYVTFIRLEKAKALLCETTDSVAKIGEQIGIYNVSYFSTLFKKKYGMTPSQFREQQKIEL